MKVIHILEDLEKAFDTNSEFRGYSVGFAEYTEDRNGRIYLKELEAIDWDEDQDFFLVPKGIAKHYELAPRSFSALELYNELRALPEIHEFQVYARSQTKVAADGSVISVNSPTWATNYSTLEQVIYFQHGDGLDS